MNVFTEAIHERLSQEHQSLALARAEKDLFAQDLHEAELENLYRIALRNGVALPSDTRACA
jgi:hypothetical protein